MLNPTRLETDMPGVLHDNLDDRREIHHLLARLSPSRRVAFVDECCRGAVLPGSAIRPGVARKTRDLAEVARRDSSADSRLTLNLFMDLWYLHLHYRWDFDASLSRLVELVRLHG